MRTQIAIVGAGPSGTLLSLILHRAGIESVIVERRSKDYVLNRIRAGVLESSSAEILRSAGLGDRLDREGDVHHNVKFASGGESIIDIEFLKLVGKPMIAYGQTMIQEDLYAAAEDLNLDIRYECDDVELHDITGDTPYVTFVKDGEPQRLDCAFIAGCDGQHGASQKAIPDEAKNEFERSYPFGWLGILSETPPLPELVYANHETGFALCSQRNENLSRYYVQCPLEDSVDDWSDDRFWTSLLEKLPLPIRDSVATGSSIEKSIAPLRSRVIDPMQYGRLFVAGDSAHIVPPTGAKGLNLAISDVHYLSGAFIAHYTGDSSKLSVYSETALRRVWSSVRFSWWMTVLLHRFPDQSPFEQKMREHEMAYLSSSEAARASVAEQYVGLDL